MRALAVLLVALALAGVAPASRAQLPDEAPVRVPVAAREVARGVVLGAADVRWEEMAASRAGSAAFGDTGWVTRRLIRAGEPLRAPAVAPRPAVRIGEPVTVMIVHGGLRLTRAGVATGNAAEGERVTVRLDARRRVDGIAAGDGIVHVATPDE